MITKMDGACYIEMMRSGLRNLEKHRARLNDLNVFPVPDGDTGTNMVMTLRCGFDAIKDKEKSLYELAGRFASSAVFGARGNSGVIISQFFKGLSAGLGKAEVSDGDTLAKALESGSRYAYAAVSKPVEGTMLTVLRDASAAVMGARPLASVNETVDRFLREAKASLARTPELLPILKKAGVVDSGGSGVVCFFEGVQSYLNGEQIRDGEATEEAGKSESVDFSLFNKNTVFSYGYCVEGLIQLKTDVGEFDARAFQGKLGEYGESVVSSLEQDKVKIHIHTKRPGRLMDFCQRYGEFLTVKIENMTVQKLQKEPKKKEAKRFLYDPDRPRGDYAVIAVAPNEYMQQKFFEMGADVVILSEIAPSSRDFLDAFPLISSKNILVFPNSANSILASMQAGSLYKDAPVAVLNSRSVAECYAVLSIMDFDGTLDEAIRQANGTLSELCQFSVYHATKDVKYGSRRIAKNDFFSLSGNKLLDVRETLESVTLHTVGSILEKRECDVITLFYGKSISSEYVAYLVEKLSAAEDAPEVGAVPTQEAIYDLTVMFE